MLEGLIPSVGTVGDALDNALCETTIGLYKTECIRDGSPFRNGPIGTLADLENVTPACGCAPTPPSFIAHLPRRNQAPQRSAPGPAPSACRCPTAAASAPKSGRPGTTPTARTDHKA